MTINVPFRLDTVKDRDIIELLNQQTNKSAFIRLVLREYNRGFKKIVQDSQSVPMCSDDVFNSLENF